MKVLRIRQGYVRNISLKHSPLLSYIVGVSLGDGNFSHNAIKRLIGIEYSIKSGKTPKGKPTYEVNIKGSRATKLVKLIKPSIKGGEER